MILFDTFESIAGGGNIMCVCLYQKSVCKKYRTRLQSSATGFLRPATFPFPLFLFPGSIMLICCDLSFKIFQSFE